MKLSHSDASSLSKHSGIADDLRAHIVNGRFSPGSPLPTRAELSAQYQVSSVTVQKAFDRLIADGFVDATRRKGSFVVEHPPHLYRYALVFEQSPPASGHVSRYWMALLNEAMKLRQFQPRELVLYYAVDDRTDSRDYRRLLYDIQAQRLAGLIFPHGFSDLLDTSPLQAARCASRLGVAAVMSGPLVPALPTIDLDYRSFITKAVDYLAARGRKCVAMLNGWPNYRDLPQYLRDCLADCAMTTRPYWTQVCSVSEPDMAQGIAHLMMMPVQDGDMIARPDALIISDDNLVEAATAGLIASGVRVPEDVEVVVHCNFPWPPPCALPVKRLGFDIHQLLETCLDVIDAQGRGEMPPALTRLPAVFEEELF